MDKISGEISIISSLVFKSGDSKDESQNRNMQNKSRENEKPVGLPADLIEDTFSISSEHIETELGAFGGQIPYAETELSFPSPADNSSAETAFPAPSAEEAYTLSLGSTDNELLNLLDGMYDMSGKTIGKQAQIINLPLSDESHVTNLQSSNSTSKLELKNAYKNVVSAYTALSEEQNITVMGKDAIISEYIIGEKVMPDAAMPPAIPDVVLPAAPDVVLPSVPEVLLPSVPETVRPSAPEAVLPSTSETVLPAAPEAVLPTAPEVVTTLGAEIQAPSSFEIQKMQSDALISTILQDDQSQLVGGGLPAVPAELSDIPEAHYTGLKPVIPDTPRFPDLNPLIDYGIDNEVNPSEILLRNIKLNSDKAFFNTLIKDLGSAAAANLRAGNPKLISELPYSLYLFGNVGTEKRKSLEYEDYELKVSLEDLGGDTDTNHQLRLSEAIKMACIVHNLYFGDRVSFTEEIPWYSVYVDYALTHRIISEGDFENFSDFATRGETAYIFANSVPSSELSPRDNLPPPADVAEDDKYSKSINLLLRAGVLAEGAAGGKFIPDNFITHTEASIIIGRIINSTYRQ